MDTTKFDLKKLKTLLMQFEILNRLGADHDVTDRQNGFNLTQTRANNGERKCRWFWHFDPQQWGRNSVHWFHCRPRHASTTWQWWGGTSQLTSPCWWRSINTGIHSNRFTLLTTSFAIAKHSLVARLAYRSGILSLSVGGFGEIKEKIRASPTIIRPRWASSWVRRRRRPIWQGRD